MRSPPPGSLVTTTSPGLDGQGEDDQVVLVQTASVSHAGDTGLMVSAMSVGVPAQ